MRSVTTLLQSSPHSFSKPEWQLLRAYGIINGYGPRNSPVLHWFIKTLAPMFRESSADIHDFNFQKGGTEKDRLKADQGFFLRLVRDSLHTGVFLLYYFSLSIVFYLLVRAFGGKYFNYR